jgi:vacuolar protein sorting-associated protein 35
VGKANILQLYRDGKRVLECLQRALRVADSCMETATSIELFVEILDRYVYYFDQQNESVSRDPVESPERDLWKTNTSCR